VRWPLGLALLVAATALILRWAPRRHQPAWSWLSYGAMACVGLLALVTFALNLFFRVGTTFGDTYVRSPASSRSRSGRTSHPSPC